MTNNYRIGVIFHNRGEHAEEVLADFVEDLRQRGVGVGGLYQRTAEGVRGRSRMDLVDIRTGTLYSISQDLGQEAVACALDPAGLADASQVLRRDIADRVELLVISKFAGQEATGQGFVPEMSAAISAGIPILTSVSARYKDAWDEVTGSAGAMLSPDRDSLNAWWASQCDRRA